MIYKSNFIKFKCNLTKEDFYSKIMNYESDEVDMPYATWSHYHCNAVINDMMKCQTCNEKLYFLSETKVSCKKCNIEINPLDINYKCIVCKNSFSSKAKIFNPLEYKALKISIKETIIARVKAKPKNLYCGCDAEISKLKFIHRKHCKGELYQGELHNKKVIVCSKCNSLCNYESYMWTCPLCFNKFLDKPNEEKNDKEEISKKNLDTVDNDKSPIAVGKNKKMSQRSKTDIKALLFKNMNKKDDSIEKENIDNNKDNVKENNIRTSILKLLEKNGNNLPLKSIQSRLFTEINNRHMINILEEKGMSNLSNFKKKNLALLCSKLVNFTPNTGNKGDSNNKIMSKIPKGNLNYLKFNGEQNLECIEAKNLDSLFKQSIEKNEETITSQKPNNRIHKAISSQNIQKSNIINSLEVEVESTINNENSLQKKKSNGGPIRGLLNRMKKYHIPIFSENGEKKVNKGIRHSQEKVKEQNIHINHSGVRSIENEHINVRRKLSKLNKNREISKNIYEKEINKIDLLKDFNIADYKIIKQIGQGTFGQIFMVEDKFHQNYALKKIIASSEIEIKGLKQEYQILYDIQSNLKDSKNRISIVNIYGLSTNQLDPTTYAMYVLMELGSCDWEKEVLERQKQKRYYTEQELMNILIVLVGTLAQLQKENISHRDIKPQNVLVFRNSNNVDYKLADFGEAKELLGGSRHTEKQTLRGTELYMSPILFYGLRSRKIKKYIKHNAYKSDVFSLGLCLLFAATLCFEVLYDIRELQNNVSVKIIIEKYLKKRYSYKIISIICSMLDINETTRDDFIELKARIEKI